MLNEIPQPLMSESPVLWDQYCAFFKSRFGDVPSFTIRNWLGSYFGNRDMTTYYPTRSFPIYCALNAASQTGMIQTSRQFDGSAFGPPGKGLLTGLNVLSVGGIEAEALAYMGANATSLDPALSIEPVFRSNLPTSPLLRHSEYAYQEDGRELDDKTIISHQEKYDLVMCLAVLDPGSSLVELDEWPLICVSQEDYLSAHLPFFRLLVRCLKKGGILTCTGRSLQGINKYLAINEPKKYPPENWLTLNKFTENDWGIMAVTQFQKP